MSRVNLKHQHSNMKEQTRQSNRGRDPLLQVILSVQEQISWATGIKTGEKNV